MHSKAAATTRNLPELILEARSWSETPPIEHGETSLVQGQATGRKFDLNYATKRWES